MPATVIPDQTEGLRLFVRNGTEIGAVWQFFLADVPGDTALSKMANALNDPGLPSLGAGLVVRLPGTNTFRAIYPQDYEVTPWSDGDATVTVTYAERDLSIPSGGLTGRAFISGGTSVKQIETEFTYDEMQKPFLQRTPIEISYDADQNGAISGGRHTPQGVRVPAFVPDACVTFTRYERTNPMERSLQYTAKRNASPWMGAQKYSLLMLAVTFDQLGSSLFRTGYVTAYDPITLHNAVARYIDVKTGLPVTLTKEQVAGQNGIKEIVVQGDEDFNALNIQLV
jgi:hypothetical protein